MLIVHLKIARMLSLEHGRSIHLLKLSGGENTRREVEDWGVEKSAGT